MLESFSESFRITVAKVALVMDGEVDLCSKMSSSGASPYQFARRRANTMHWPLAFA